MPTYKVAKVFCITPESFEESAYSKQLSVTPTIIIYHYYYLAMKLILIDTSTYEHWNAQPVAAAVTANITGYVAITAVITRGGTRLYQTLVTAA